MFQRFVPGLLGVVLCAAIASAQATLTVPTSISVGNDISIGYSDPSRAGQTITVTVDLCDPDLAEVQLIIHLDQSGRGTVTWTVPDVIGLAFNAPGVREIARAL